MHADADPTRYLGCAEGALPLTGAEMSHHLLALLAYAAIMTPSSARAEARLISVVPVDGGCVSGPTGSGVQHWDVESGKTYEMFLSHVVECANGHRGD